MLRNLNYDLPIRIKPCMKKIAQVSLVLVFAMLFHQFLTAQITGLAGTLSQLQVRVTNINSANNSVDVTSAAGFAIGDTVLLIQMKGATVNETNTASFGNIDDLGNAGQYEFATICDVTGNTVTFTNNILNPYTIAGHVQMIQVPVYQNVVIGGTITADAWDLSTGTGGVMVVAARGWLRLNAPVRMNGAGFSGGWDLNSYSPCDCNCAFGGGPTFTDFHYNSGNCRAASKGESIADSVSGKEFGKGKLAAGGGGGNDHNAGGGGGGNYGAGGQGGTTNNPSCFFGSYCRGNDAGIGGLSLATYINSNNRIFLGSGGGSGHDNNTTGTPGVNGGGIIIIIADSLEGGNRPIEAKGADQLFAAQGDGSGGGGGGGTVILNVRAYGPGNLTVDVSGGKGGDNSWGGSATNCKGPGGGGGGGVIYTSGAGMPGTATAIVSGGQSGTNAGATCNGNSLGATNGGNGAVLSNWAYRSSGTSFVGCLLPVEYASFAATAIDNGVRLDWMTAFESNNSHFEVQRSADGSRFQPIGRVDGTGNSFSPNTYTYLDATPVSGTSWYRLRQIDLNGASSYSEVRSVTFAGKAPLIRNVYPNPVRDGILHVTLDVAASSNMQLEIYDPSGRVAYTVSESFTPGEATLQLPVNALAAGVYFLKVSGQGRTGIRKFIVR